MNIISLPRTALSIALALAVITPIAALAQRPAAATGVDPSSLVVVKYGDLDLSRPEAAALLLTRVQTAAKTACAQFDGKELAQVALFHTCVEHAVEGAIQHIDRPTLTALYTAKTGKKLAPALMLSSTR